MQLIGIEIRPRGTHALVLAFGSTLVLAKSNVSPSWIEGLPPSCREQQPTQWIETPEKTTHLARTTEERVVLRPCHAINRLIEMGFDPEEIHLTGAGAASPTMRQLLADALGAPVAPLSSRHGGTFAPPIQAAVAFFQQCCQSLEFSIICTYLVSTDEVSHGTPNAENHEPYQQLIGRKQNLVGTLHPAGFL